MKVYPLISTQYLIFLLNGNVVWSKREELGVVRRLASFRGDDDKVQFSISAFGEEMLFNFTRNKDLIPPGFKIKTILRSYKAKEEEALRSHFIYESSSFIASLSDYGNNEIYGFISGQGKTIEINPLSKNLLSAVRSNPNAFGFDSPDTSEIFLMKQIKLPSLSNDEHYFIDPNEIQNRYRHLDRRYSNKMQNLTIELAVFVDYEAFNGLLDLYNSANKAFHVLLAHMNQVHALFKMRSLQTKVDISLTKLEVLDREFFPKYIGERKHLLESFCNYQYKLNNPKDDNPNHWDLAVLLTGLNLWTESSTRGRDYSTLGIAPTNGICTQTYSCAVAELRGRIKQEDQMPISSGFGSSYIMAHEIGHTLGLSHDGSDDECSKDGFLMSSTRDRRGEAQWSECSARKLKILNKDLQCLYDSPGFSRVNLEQKTKYKGIPGFFIKSDKQCQLYLRDVSAIATLRQTNECQVLLCSSYDGSIYKAGPALTGTPCGNHQWCIGGKCVERPKWSKWKYGPCKSGCLQSSLGIRTLQRNCLSGSDCIGRTQKSQLCDDNSYCERKSAQRTITFISRKSRTIFADRQCKGFARTTEFQLRSNGGKAGAIIKHVKSDPKRACIIYCRSRNKGWISPSSPNKDDFYFPEGTWCNYDDQTGQHYYCINHLCVPEKNRKKKKFDNVIFCKTGL
ncbi:A disintegrin and metalloproteinase with thrombospondin motifs adt-1 [Lepeophtheirus salmonis]|uniref:A disintegrin and metalloproteinase with thrombospondin motifs adt-1 n=1 Tax=Lepeophtheirus salmonis TaxID=72036 RepID=UPI001AE6DC89|nr:A disintegrin and metalloproteinase with thrombospondin motifs adt-1-like [Lepeophtheirus salmonis]